MERIICDSYIKGQKEIWGEDRNAEFNRKILAVNEMYGWLYEKGILEKVSFEFKDYSFGTCFALDVKDLLPYREQMEKSGLDGSELAVQHIFDVEYTPCMYSGAIELGWTMASYREVDGCVGRSWECGLVQAMNVEQIYQVLAVQEEKGVKEAVKRVFEIYPWKETDLDKKQGLDQVIADADRKKKETGNVRLGEVRERY